MLFTLAYNIGLTLYVIGIMPVVVYQMVVKGKYRKNFLRRFGWRIPHVDKGGRKVIWVHAISMGETRAIAPLAKRLKEKMDDAIVVVSATTETGYAEGERSLPFAEYRLYFPLDFSFLAKRAMRRIQPDLFVLCETDFWYHHLKEAKRIGAKRVLVSGKISEKSLDRFKKRPWIARRVFSLIDHFCVQDEEYRHRFRQLGVPDSKITVTGNLKYDQVPQKLSDRQREALFTKLKLKDDDHIITVGSTHAPEEENVLSELRGLLKQDKKLKILLVPRHPERFDAVVNLANKTGLKTGRYSEAQCLRGGEQIIVVDTMGLLRQCYELSQLAVMGGSFAPIGGHNALESVAVGTPILMGPHMFAQKEMTAMILNAGAGKQIPLDDISHEVQALLHDDQKRQSFAQSGSQLIAALQGTTKRTEEKVLLEAKP